MSDIPVLPHAQVIVPDCAYHVPGFLNEEVRGLLGPAIVTETYPRWVAQLTYNKGWPARVDKGHTMARFGDPDVTYTYKGKPKPMYAFTPSLDIVRTEIARVLGWRPNCVVVNSYQPASGLYPHRDGNYIPQLGQNPVIVAVSFGTTRTFQLFPSVPGQNKRVKGAAPIEVQLGDGDLFVMHGECDTTFHHGIPEEHHLVGTRVSLTFRKHLTI